MDEELRRRYLEALGIPLWLSRRPLATSPAALPLATTEPLSAAAGSSDPAAVSPPTRGEFFADDDGMPPMSDDWELVNEFGEEETPPLPPADSRAARIAGLDWAALEAEVRPCTACDLCQSRTQTVFGVGNRQADWLVIGEAPGADEDQQGEPFVGRAGKLLNPMLQAIGLPREQVFITNILKCLRYNALVQLADGSWERIGRLVRSRYAGKVMSVDRAGRLVPRRVVGWHESPRGGRQIFRLSYQTAKNAGASRVGIQLTGDHEVLTRRGYVPVAQLRPNDDIATGQGLSPLAFDVVCGTLLGDGTLNAQSAYLEFSHSIRQRDYALFKASLLAELKPRWMTFAVAATVGGEKNYPTLQVRTLAHRALRSLRADFYTPRKRVPTWMADRLNARMLAFWFMDDGYTRLRTDRKPLAEIATCGFSDQDLQILLAGLFRLGLPAKANRGRLCFDAVTTPAVLERIAPYLPPAMRYKLSPDIAARWPFAPELLQSEPAECFFDRAQIEDITEQKRDDRTFFCIDVEENHNFVTSGGVVHNCRPPNNRDPAPEEARSCRPFLERQIALIQPRIILAIGRIAAQNLLNTDVQIGKLRGRVHHLGAAQIPLVVTYHPAYLLRSPREKRKSWDDLRLARRTLAALSSKAP